MNSSAVSTIDLPVSLSDRDVSRLALRGENAILLRDLRRRTAPVFTLLDRHVWPDAELRTLTRFLHTVVLRQAADEEALLYPTGASAPLVELTAAHARLRLLTEQLDQADSTSWPPPHLRSMLEELLALLEQHLYDEQAVLAALPEPGRAVPASPDSAPTGRPRWGSPDDLPIPTS